MPGTWRHLAARFFGVLRSRPLTATERDYVGTLLAPAERPSFFAKAEIDQRHGHEQSRIHLVDRCLDELGGIEGDIVRDPSLTQLLAHAIHGAANLGS